MNKHNNIQHIVSSIIVRHDGIVISVCIGQNFDTKPFIVGKGSNYEELLF